EDVKAALAGTYFGVTRKVLDDVNHPLRPRIASLLDDLVEVDDGESHILTQREAERVERPFVDLGLYLFVGSPGCGIVTGCRSSIDADGKLLHALVGGRKLVPHPAFQTLEVSGTVAGEFSG